MFENQLLLLLLKLDLLLTIVLLLLLLVMKMVTMLLVMAERRRRRVMRKRKYVMMLVAVVVRADSGHGKIIMFVIGTALVRKDVHKVQKIKKCGFEIHFIKCWTCGWHAAC